MPTVIAQDIIGVQPMLTEAFWFSDEHPLIVNLALYMIHSAEFTAWCEEHNLTVRRDRTIDLGTEQMKSLFILRWK